MAAPWLGEALRAGGLPVVEEPGCHSRGTGGLFTPIGVLLHHTAGPAKGNLPSLRIVRDGRPGLPGPLSQLMLSRAGVFHVVATGRANHAGAGAASFVPNGDGNRYLIGIEAESTGRTDDWTPEQRANYPRGVAALCRAMGVSERNVLGHKEWALPRGRKIDPAFWDMNDFRADVRAHLRGDVVAPLSAPPAPPAPREDDDAMYIKCQPDKGRPGEYLTGILSGGTLMGLGTTGEIANADENINKGALCAWVDLPTWDGWANRNPRPQDVAAILAKVDELVAKLGEPKPEPEPEPEADQAA